MGERWTRMAPEGQNFNFTAAARSLTVIRLTLNG